MKALHAVLENFLGAELNSRLLRYALENEAGFVASRVGDGDGKVNESRRISTILHDLGSIHPTLEQRVLGELPALLQRLGLGAFTPGDVELQLVAHNDGAFFLRHIDTFAGKARSPESDRMLSLVYYFHREPRAFEGGTLRLYPVNGDTPIDISPQQDMAVVFPSWIPHEVLTVTCPSRNFADSRFAVNCWVLRRRGV